MENFEPGRGEGNKQLGINEEPKRSSQTEVLPKSATGHVRQVGNGGPK
jgi:hypothetical protein